MLNRAQWEKFNLFFKSFLLVITKLLFWQRDGSLGYHSMDLETFLIFPNFQRSQVLSCSANRKYHVYK